MMPSFSPNEASTSPNEASCGQSEARLTCPTLVGVPMEEAIVLTCFGKEQSRSLLVLHGSIVRKTSKELTAYPRVQQESFLSHS